MSSLYCVVACLIRHGRLDPCDHSPGDEEGFGSAVIGCAFVIFDLDIRRNAVVADEISLDTVTLPFDATDGAAVEGEVATNAIGGVEFV